MLYRNLFFSASMCSCSPLNFHWCLVEVFDKKRMHFHGLSDKNKTFLIFFSKIEIPAACCDLKYSVSF